MELDGHFLCRIPAGLETCSSSNIMRIEAVVNRLWFHIVFYRP